MSNRDSLGIGDLLPQDVVDIFAQEKHSRRGKKKRSHSLGRALGWLKGKKRKDLDAKGLGLGPALDLAVDGHPAGHHGPHKGGQRSGRQAHPQANAKLDDDKTPAPPLLQENVFIEASRPKYLENLHTEAQEGLKMMQQDEIDHGVEYRDNESTISTMTVQTDREGGGFITDSTIGDTTSVVSVQSSVSTRSSRSGLTRQESTFRPLNSGNKSEKPKKRKRHRKTVAGIPQHIQMELGLDRGGWKVTQRLDEEQLYNGETDTSPTTDGPQKGASAISENTNIIQPINKNQLKQLGATHAGHRDDMALLHYLGPDLSDEQRPRSLAVPWITTANSVQQESPSPVMSMSPQAAYMSKIIPNAVLPPSIDVVEISCGRSRNSVRTVSKSSLLLSSPAPSRASSRATSSRASTINSGSRSNPPNMSDSSCWSHSDSSETLVSDSTTISRSSTPRQKSQEGDSSPKDGKCTVSSSLSKPPVCTSNGEAIIKGEVVKKEGPFTRSLSVMKPKRAPPPPNRSYSLHNKMKRRSRDLAQVSVTSGESSQRSISVSSEENDKNKSFAMPSRILESPGYNADTSSLDDSTGSVPVSPIGVNVEKAAKVVVAVSKDASPEKQEPLRKNKISKIVSPSSGYSSQDGKSAQPHSSSSRQKKGILAKLQRLFPGSSPPASTRRPFTPPAAPENSKLKKDLNPNPNPDRVDTASVNPSVRALIELFNIPPPPKVRAPPPPPPEVWAHSKRTFELLLGPPAPDNIHAIIKKNPKDRRQQRKSSSSSTDTSASVKSLVERKHKNPTLTVETMKVKESVILNAEIREENNDRLDEQNVDLKGNRKVTEKDEKVRVRDMLNGMLVKAVERRDERLATVREEEAKKTSTQVTEVDSLPAISLKSIPLTPSLTPAHNSPQIPTKQTPGLGSVASGQVVVSPELLWPPPPPPIGLIGSDEFDLPLPPPPVFSEEGLVTPIQVPPAKSIPGGDTSCITTSVLSVVQTECVRPFTQAEPQKPSTHQGIVPTLLNIPPPPPYTAPPPPVKAVSPPTIKTASLPLQQEVSDPNVSPSRPKEISPRPSKKVFLPPPKPIAPPLPKEVSIPSPKKVSSPLPREVSPPPPEEVSPHPPPKEVSSLQPKEVFLPPPEEIPPPPKEIPPPPPREISLPPPEEIPPPPPKDVSLPLTEEIPPPPPKEVSLSPPEEIPPPPPKEIPPPPPTEVSLPPPEEIPPSPPKEISPVRPKESPPSLTQEVSPLLVSVVSPSPVKDVSTEVVSPPARELAPQNIPPLPLSQPQSSEQEIDLSQEDIPSKSEINPISYSSILTPPQSILPPLPIELLSQPQVTPTKPDGPATQEVPKSPPSDVSVQPALINSISTESSTNVSPPVSIPLPPPLPVEGLEGIKQQPNPSNTENQTPELTCAPVVQEEPTLIVTPSLLQVVKLRSVNSSPEPPEVKEQPQNGATMNNQEPNHQAPTLSANVETPQKPIRRSLIVTSPTPTSPPAVGTSPAAQTKSVVIPPASSSTAVSPTKKSPPATTAAPSMNLQEAIRLRTAARSLGGPAPRISLHSPTPPTDLHKSPTSTASFIFSKSNKRVVIETKPAPEENATIKKNQGVSSLTAVGIEAESMKKGVKVPPPVAKKPKTKGTEVEASVGTEQTAGQEALQESIMDAAEKRNGTAGTVEGGETPST